MRSIQLDVLTSPSCVRCEEFVSFWKSVSGDWEHVTMKEISVLTSEGQELARRHLVFTSPGIIIDQELFTSGGFSKTEFLGKLQVLSLS